MNKREQQEGARLRELGCMACRRLKIELHENVDLHHVREGRLGVRGSKMIPLCFLHHRIGPEALHVLGSRAFEAKFGFSEDDLLADLQLLLGEA
jgi:hypothetical protein